MQVWLLNRALPAHECSPQVLTVVVYGSAEHPRALVCRAGQLWYMAPTVQGVASLWAASPAQSMHCLISLLALAVGGTACASWLVSAG